MHFVEVNKLLAQELHERQKWSKRCLISLVGLLFLIFLPLYVLPTNSADIKTIFYGGLSYFDAENNAIPYNASKLSLNEASDSKDIALFSRCSEDAESFVVIRKHPYMRMGNLMFAYASLYGIARKSCHRPLILEPPEFSLHVTFPNLSIPKLSGHSFDRTYNQSLQIISTKKGATFYDNLIGSLQHNQSYRVDGYLQSWKYFLEYDQQIKSEFRFSTRIIAQAKSALFRTLSTVVDFASAFNYTSSSYNALRQSIILIGVHIRRGDMLSAASQGYGFTVGSADYLTNAMLYLNITLSNQNAARSKLLVFLLLGNDAKWSTFFAHNMTAAFNGSFTLAVPKPVSAEVDLCLLSLCDHVIMTVGSYGWWGAFLSPGLKVYQKEQAKAGSYREKIFRAEDWFPEDWIGLDINGSLV